MQFISSNISGRQLWQIDTWLNHGMRHAFLGKHFNAQLLKKGRSEDALKDVLDELSPIVLQLNQVHAANFIKVLTEDDLVNVVSMQKEGMLLNADGWFFNRKLLLNSNYCFGIKTADCYPVMIASLSSSLFAVLHCGWRSIVAGILSVICDEFFRQGCSLADLQVAIGPGAGQCCYDVDIETANDIIGSDPNATKGDDLVHFRNSKEKCFINLQELIIRQLLSKSVSGQNICCSHICTICNMRFFSHRREGKNAGRQISIAA